MSDHYQEMLAELAAAKSANTETTADLAKSIPVPDEGESDDDESSEDEEDEKDEEDGDGTFGKAFGVTLADGSTVQAYDGTQMMKALHAEAKRSGDALRATVDLVKSLQTTINTQASMIKSLQGDVARLGTGGRGRRTTLTIHDKPGATGADQEPKASREAIMAKSLNAQRSGRITGSDVARIESYFNRGIAIPPDLLERIA
ncbi:MAG: hypothetical protein GC191_09170 [Azospirillum sp.]|nr:hypothetical protein [Azospirillum sp.]